MNTPMHPSDAYLRLAEGPEDLVGNELSLTRRLLTLVVAVVLFSGTSLFATAALDLDHDLIGKALASSGPGSGGTQEDDHSGPGGGGDDDDEADDAPDNRGPGNNNLATGGGASHSDDNHDGNTDSSTHQAEQRVKADDSNSDQNHDGNTDSSHGRQVTDSGTDDNHNGATDSHERGQRVHR